MSWIIGATGARARHPSHAVAQYAAPLAAQFSDPHETPEQYPLWFHHLPWDYRLESGRTLWDELVIHDTGGYKP